MGGKTRNIAIQPRFVAMLQDKLHVFVVRFFPYFKQPRRQRNRQSQKTIDLMSQTAYLRVCHAF